MQDAALILQDGKCFWGKSVGKKGKCIGEVCFTTGMTGYQHTITDPSFADQIITFTFPHIGNVGINHKDNEGKKIFASGVVMRELSSMSHPSSYISLNDWLEKNNVIGISGVDTRALTRHLREHGSQNGMICSSSKAHALDKLKEYKPVNGIEITNKVSLNNSFENNRLAEHFVIQVADYSDPAKNIWIPVSRTGMTSDRAIDLNAKYRIVIVDFGVKISIVSRLIELGCTVELIRPSTGFAQKVLSMNPDGIVLSNGPGDPQEIGESVVSEIDIIIKSKIPIFGICMGHQLLAITLGAKTIKMDIGHRGSNHPVYDVISGKVEITSQNHGFVVDSASLPSNVEITHISLFDNSVEGIMMKDYLVFSVQYHPEEAPGTHDSHYLFRRFIGNIVLYKMKSA
ncbi:glutamine-hydrolyzing carbamoyl-phosphate synthase small subunit [Wolbachia endosymbiont of Wiebesia pumilae]|uniref:glutamine-hydrolyzing carbamoyl-phosphate synthase small subunit n=1 Tax=Wolbachia endosymbiont of Wiebesia pumilae TaxID=2742717 RepID=UPI001AE173E2|nr:glutamine-hydrolyzing carbamoyl-phosphate synthase small subunit [Wolbachia endosymbiont of Wiebesia pumilae]QTP61699.1 glutamine-hydrolyzing carbamoyl-phosphate synthase small subunit [Wolbachia endosymbiont of Wiebesia pumilae]